MTSTSTQQQAESMDTCANPGNPVFSCMISPKVTAVRAGPWAKPQNPLYRTTSNDYGRLTPTFGRSLYTYYPKSQRFSEELAKCGMYQDNSFNTAIDRSRVHNCRDRQHTI